MRRLYQLLLWLYPSHIRSEFGDEMSDVFSEASLAERRRGPTAYFRFCAREVGGLILNLPLQGRIMKHKRLIWQGGLAGLLIGGAFGLARDAQPYTSMAVLRVVPSTVPERLAPAQADMKLHLPSLIESVTARAYLRELVNRHNLYPGDRPRVPVEDLVLRMRAAISVTIDKESSFRVSFSYPDRIRAQRVTGDLVSRIMSWFVREHQAEVSVKLQFVKDSANQAGNAFEESLVKLRTAQSQGRPLERVRLDADIARQRYERLSERVAEAEMLAELERRLLGQTLQLMDPASLPSESRGALIPAASSGILVGALLGWLVSVALAARSRRSVVEPA